MAARLRREVLAVVGGARMPTYDDVRGMKYLRAFINGAYILHSLFSPVIALCQCDFICRNFEVVPPCVRPLHSH
jgi:hypothetical protein